MIWKNTKLHTELNKKVREHPEIKDIFMFGSAIRGKEHPNDIDILLLFKNKVDKNIEYTVRTILQKYLKNISIISKTEHTMMDEAFDARESMLFEAKSLLTGKNVAQQYGFSAFGLCKYTFGTWTLLQKTKFYHALNGRGKETGIIQKLEGIKLSDSVILVPLEYIEQFRAFLEYWKLEYTYVPILLPSRLGRKSILENKK